MDIAKSNPDELLKMIREIKCKPFAEWDRDLLKRIKAVYHEKTANYPIIKRQSTVEHLLVA